MKILFISSGKSGKVGEVVKNQGESLEATGVQIDYFLINPGLKGYISSILKLRSVFRKGEYDIAHAHYNLSGFVATLAGCKPLVVSLMGSDAFMSKLFEKITRLFSRHIWDKTIVKTSEIKDRLNIHDALIIPNGVNIKRFKPIPQEEARNYLNISEGNYLIIFIAKNNRPEKNLGLANGAFNLLDYKNIKFKHVHSVDNSEIPYYLNAADVLLLTSRREGSVNVVKEAMACSCPVVSTDVGDVSWVFGTTEGCYLTSFEIENITENLRKALEYGRRTNGRQRIIDLGLDSETVASKLVDVYKGLVPEIK